MFNAFQDASIPGIQDLGPRAEGGGQQSLPGPCEVPPQSPKP